MSTKQLWAFRIKRWFRNKAILWTAILIKSSYLSPVLKLTVSKVRQQCRKHYIIMVFVCLKLLFGVARRWGTTAGERGRIDNRWADFYAQKVRLSFRLRSYQMHLGNYSAWSYFVTETISICRYGSWKSIRPLVSTMPTAHAQRGPAPGQKRLNCGVLGISCLSSAS